MRQKAIERDRRQYQMNDADWSMIKGNELLSGRSLCTTDPPMAARVNLPIDTSKSVHKSKQKSTKQSPRNEIKSLPEYGSMMPMKKR